MPEAVTWSHKERTVLLWQHSHALQPCSGQAQSLWMNLGSGCPALQLLPARKGLAALPKSSQSHKYWVVSTALLLIYPSLVLLVAVLEALSTVCAVHQSVSHF